MERGDVDHAREQAVQVLRRTYLWPYQMHASIGPSCSVARVHKGRLQVWSGTQNPHLLRTELSRLMDMGEGEIDIIRLEASGCYGRNCADDVGGDAALLARAVGRPVRVQLSRQQEHLWEPKGSAQLVDVVGSIDVHGAPLSYELLSRYPTNDAPLLAGLLTGRTSNAARPMELGCRTAVPPYDYPNLRIRTEDVAPIARASWFRGVSSLPNSFAHDSFIDELAAAAKADPLDYRLTHLPDPRARELLQAVAERFGWRARPAGSRGRVGDDGWMRGCGLGYARYVHSNFPGFGAAYAAWAVEVAYEHATGRVAVKRVVVGQDAGLMVNPDGVRHQIHGNIVQILSRVLKEEVRFNACGTAARDWGAYPLITFPELPAVTVVLMDRPGDPPLGSGESTSVPAPAAIANALFDATGERFRQAPFTPERVRAVLEQGKAATR
jgi:isoquinoline 1-oxidoreductase